MSITRQASSLAAVGRVSEAYHLLDDAKSRDAEAASLLADWRMAGHLIRRDIGEARRLYGIAGDMGDAIAEASHIALLASGAGGSGRDWELALHKLSRSNAKNAKRQLDLLQRMAIDRNGDPTELASPQNLCDGQEIWELPSFLNLGETAYLVDLAKPVLQPSTVVDPTSGRLIHDPIRKSSSAPFPFTKEDPVLHAINRRIAAASGSSYKEGEPLQILHYSREQEYKLHSDALPKTESQRIKTLIIYLNDDYGGGETYFPNLQLRYRGRTGDALMFSNVDTNDRMASQMIHAGLPVSSGEKYIASKWIRRAPLDLTGPSGKPF